MHYLSPVDWGIVILYFCFLVGLGFYLKKRASESIEDYFIGGRKLPWWALGISGMASWLDITGTMMVVSFLYMLGPRGLYIQFRGGVGMLLIFMMLWGGKWHRRSQCITGAEWMTFRFGNGPGGQFAQFVSVLAGFIGTIGGLAYLITGVGMFLSMFLPFTPFQCAAMMITVATCYTMLSGFYGVIFTDLFQVFFICIAVITISVMAFLRIGQVEDMGALAELATGNNDWLAVSPPWETTMPAGYEKYKHVILFACFYLLRNAFSGISSGADPKYFGARNDRECGLLSFVWGWMIMLRWPMMIGFAVLGISLVTQLFPDQSVLADAANLIKTEVNVEESGWAKLIANISSHPEAYPATLTDGLQNTLGGEDWRNRLHMVSYHGNVNPERILPAVLLFEIPAGLRAILLIAMLAASMSSFDSIINATCALITRDIYQKHIRPQAKTKELVYVSWCFVLLIVVLAFLLATTIRSINDIWAWLVMGLSGGLLIPSFLKMLWWRFNGGGFAVGIAVGLTAAVTQRLLYPDLDERLQFVILALIGATGAITGTLLTPPTKREVLERFYRTTRPFGFWGPLRKELPESTQRHMYNEHRRDIAALPFGLIWLVSLLMLVMQIVLREWTSALITGIFFLIGLGGLYMIWMRHLPEDNYPVPEWHAEDTD